MKDYNEFPTRGEKRASVRKKLEMKQVKHWYGEVWRKNTELHFTGGFTKAMQKIINKGIHKGKRK